MSTLNPCRGYCLIQPILEQETTQSGLIMPDEVQKRQAKGKVLRLGLPHYNVKGDQEIIECEIGDTVWFKQFGGEPIKEQGHELIIVPYTAILGVYR